MVNDPEPNQSSINGLPHSTILPLALSSNESFSELVNNPGTSTSHDSEDEPDQFPNDIRRFMRYCMERNVEQARKEDDRAQKAEERIERLQRAIVEAIKPPPSQDPKTRFWNEYKTISEDHDKDFCTKYKGDLGTSLIFAGLFSTVCSAFIVQVQSNLQQNPDDVTQALLRLLIHTTNDTIFSGPDLTIPEWNGPPPSIVAVQSILYFSLFATLLVAFLAMLGKQWVAYYTEFEIRGTTQQRGIERQKKLHGFHRWGFESVMTVLPVLLQISLLLFGVAVTVYLWSLQRTIAGIVLALSSLGTFFYFCFVFSDIFATDSPFRTPLSARLLKKTRVKSRLQSMANLVWGRRRSRKAQFGDLESILPPRPADEMQPIHRETPLYALQQMENGAEYEYLAVLWMLDTSTEPDIIAITGSMAVELQWSPLINFVPALIRWRDTFIGCFEGESTLRLRETEMNHAISCGQAYYHFYAIYQSLHDPSNRWNREVDFPTDFLDRIEGGDSIDGPFESAELNFIYSCLKGTFSWIEYSSFSPSFFRWALHIAPYHFYFKPASPKEYLPIPYLIRPPNLGFLDRSSLTNVLLYMGSYLGLPLSSRDLVVVDKSEHFGHVLNDLQQHLSRRDGIDLVSPRMIDSSETVARFLLSDPCNQAYTHNFCWGRLPTYDFKPEVIIGVMRLFSMYQADPRRDHVPPHILEPSILEDREWMHEIPCFVNQQFIELEADKNWDDRIVNTIANLLRVLIQVPHFGRYIPKPSHQFLRILSKSMSGGSDARISLRHLAYSVIWLAQDYWFDDAYSRPVLQELNIFSRLGSIVDSDIVRYEPSYMDLVGKLSGMHTWVSVIRYDLYRWIDIYERLGGEEQNVVLAFKKVSAMSEGMVREVETWDTSVLAIQAMGSVWNNFNFSARIAIESFCPLARCTWTLLHPGILGDRELSMKAVGEPFVADLKSAIQHAHMLLLEGKNKVSQTQMEQNEIKAVDEIDSRLKDIEEYLLGTHGEELLHRSLIIDENIDLGKIQNWRIEYSRFCNDIDSLNTLLLELLTRPRCYLGMK